LRRRPIHARLAIGFAVGIPGVAKRFTEWLTEWLTGRFDGFSRWHVHAGLQRRCARISIIGIAGWLAAWFVRRISIRNARWRISGGRCGWWLIRRCRRRIWWRT